MSERDLSTHPDLHNELINFNQQIDSMIANLKKEISDLRREQAETLIERYVPKEIDEKIMRYLSKILICLFGRTDAEKFFMNFVKLKQVTCFHGVSYKFILRITR